MYNNKLKTKEIKEKFKDKESFSYTDLLNFYLETEPDLKIGTYKWRVYKLKEIGFLDTVRKGEYILGTRVEFAPIIKLTLKKQYNLITKKYPYIEVVVWETGWLNEFMIHQPFISLTIIEVDREAITAVFNTLKETNVHVYLDPTIEDIENYIISQNSIVVKPLLRESPSKLIGKINTPKIEKILVDIFTDSNLFITYQGYELERIYESIFTLYSVNMTTLERYAKNRGGKEDIKKFIGRIDSISKKYK